MPSWKKVIISGSNSALNSLKITEKLEVTGSLTISGSSTFRNIGPGEFTGSVGILGSLTISSGSFFVDGKVVTKTTPVTASSYTITNSDYRLGVRYTQTGSTTLFLPPISASGERDIRIKDESGNADTNNIIVSASVGNFIDGSPAVILDRNYIAISLYNDNSTNWYIE